ncbi:MAG: bisanhydrobacterioruberin hydratase [Haloarculaceae archaeon]
MAGEHGDPDDGLDAGVTIQEGGEGATGTGAEADMGTGLPEATSPRGRRQRAEARLEATVAANRFTIAVVFPVVGAILLLASAAELLPPPLAFNPLLVLAGTAVMRLPLAAGLSPLIDRRAALALVLLAAYTYAIEYVGATTGVPYGEFEYGIALGPMFEGTLPLALPLFFLPLVLDGYLLADRVRDRVGLAGWTRPAAGVLAILAIDVVLDPAAVAIGFWTYAAGGPVYGVPLSNFAGWLLSAGVAVALVEVGFDTAALRDRARNCQFLLDDLISFVILWGLVLLLTARWASVAVVLVLLALLAATGYFRSGQEPA